ncbi:hypothetical protein ACFL3V_00380 [Nanoarchaeota archaeon]
MKPKKRGRDTRKGLSKRAMIWLFILAISVVALIWALATSQDFDSDGIPDFLDNDADDDGVPRSEEGMSDIDGDGAPNDLDYDSDGDNLSDHDEYFYLETHHLKKHSSKEEGNIITGDMIADEVYGPHDGHDSDGNGVPDRIQSHPSGYYYNERSGLHEICRGGSRDCIVGPDTNAADVPDTPPAPVTSSTPSSSVRPHTPSVTFLPSGAPDYKVTLQMGLGFDKTGYYTLIGKTPVHILFENEVDWDGYMWMTNNYKLLQNRKFKEIIFPASHDAGTYSLSGILTKSKYGGACPGHDWKDNTGLSHYAKYTQDYDFYQQLLFGARLLEWRPYYQEANDRIHIYHNYVGIAIEPPNAKDDYFSKDYALRQLRAYMDKVKDKKELVLIYVSNPCNVPAPKLERLLASFTKELTREDGDDYLYKVQHGTFSKLRDTDFNDIVGSGSKVIIALQADNFAEGYHRPDKGFWRIPMKGEWSQTTNVDKLKSNQSAFLTGFVRNNPNDDSFLGVGWTLTTGFDGNIFPVKDLAKDANPELRPWMDTLPKDVFQRINVAGGDYIGEIGTQYNAVWFNKKRNFDETKTRIAHLTHSDKDGKHLGDGGYITYLTWNGGRWMAELHRFEEADGTANWVFKHTQEHGKSVHWDAYMNFKAWGGKNYAMTIDDKGWAFAPEGDWTSKDVIRQPFGGEQFIRYKDWGAWGGNDVQSDWDGTFLP